MKLWAVFLSVAIASCGGGSSSGSPASTVVQSPTVYDYADFAPYKKNTVGMTSGGLWSTTVLNNLILVYWQGSGVEEHELVVYQGQRWVWLNAYQSNGYRWQITTDRAEIRHDSTWTDITPPADMQGQPYALRDIASSYEIRVWGKVLDDPRHCADVGQSPCNGYSQWFWQARYDPAVPVFDSCWITDPLTTRLAIAQSEVWADNNRPDHSWKWGTGSGDITSDGNPTGGNIVYGHRTYIGEKSGWNWQFVDYPTGGTQCLISIQ